MNNNIKVKIYAILSVIFVTLLLSCDKQALSDERYKTLVDFMSLSRYSNFNKVTLVHASGNMIRTEYDFFFIILPEHRIQAEKTLGKDLLNDIILIGGKFSDINIHSAGRFTNCWIFPSIKGFVFTAPGLLYVDDDNLENIPIILHEHYGPFKKIQAHWYSSPKLVYIRGGDKNDGE